MHAGGADVRRSSSTFQAVIGRLQDFWEQQGCVVMQPYHTEVGAGTFNPATFLRCLDARPWRAAYVEPSMRPTDGRYGENPYRLGHYYQYQVVIKPSPPDIQDLYLQSLVALGIDLREHIAARRHNVVAARPNWRKMFMCVLCCHYFNLNMGTKNL